MVLKNRSYLFAIEIVKLTQVLQSEKREYVLSKQLLRSGTAIGALIREAEFAESKADFAHKMSISLKEANESQYWISLLKDTDYLDISKFNTLDKECRELIAMLAATVKTARKNRGKE